MPGGLDDDQVVPGGLARGDDVVEVVGELAARVAGGEGPVEDHAGGDGVHPDAVAQQRAAAAAGGVDGEDGDPHLVLAVAAQPAHQLVGEGGLAGAAGAGDAEHRDPAVLGRVPDRGGEPLVGAGLEHGDGPGERGLVPGEERVEVGLLGGEVDVALADEHVDHAGEAQPLAVLRAEDAHPALGEQLDLVRDDHPAAPAVHLHVPGAALGEPLHQVAEVLDVAALVGGDRHAAHVLLQCRGHHLVHAAVVTEVHHLGALALQQAAHDGDRRVVAVEQAGGGDEAHRVHRYVE